MSWKFTELPYLLHTAPDELKEIIIRTLDKNQGHMANTSADIGVTRRMFLEYINRLKLRPEVDGIKDKWKRERKRLSTARTKHNRQTGQAPQSEFMEMVREKPDEARRMIRFAWEETSGVIYDVVRVLGVRRNVFLRATKELGIYEDLRLESERFRRDRLDRADAARSTPEAQRLYSL